MQMEIVLEEYILLYAQIIHRTSKASTIGHIVILDRHEVLVGHGYSMIFSGIWSGGLGAGGLVEFCWRDL